MEISGARVLLTGATGGLGNAIARQLSAAGAQLVLTGRRLEVLEPLAAELGAQALAIDLSDRDRVERLITETGEPDILVANAALPASGPMTSFTQEDIDRSLEVNLRVPMRLARAFVPGMVERHRGHLVFMSSLAGKAHAPGTTIYSATKFGLRGFAGGLRIDLHGTGVGVSVLFPGFIRDAGMFADAGVKLPPGVGTRTPSDVAQAVRGAIEHNRGEVDVAPVALRLGSAFGGLAPGIAAAVSRKLGGDLADDISEGQRPRR